MRSVFGLQLDKLQRDVHHVLVIVPHAAIAIGEARCVAAVGQVLISFGPVPRLPRHVN